MLVSRDPFARCELHRETLPKPDRRGCRCCGEPGRFRYYIETDGGRRIDSGSPLSGISASGPFCSVGCFRAFNS